MVLISKECILQNSMVCTLTTNWIGLIKNVIAKNVSVMNRVKHLLNGNALYSLCCTLMMLYLNYCCEVW